ncbi:MAG: DUF692 family multinuclear iron-containing protein [Bradymonadia bacterium]
MSDFLNERVHRLPTLGLGVSSEYGAFATSNGLNLEELYNRFPHFAQFLEVGVERALGLDDDTRRWVERQGKTTYHFLDVNLARPDLLDEQELLEIRKLAEDMDAAWVCGDAGMWYFGDQHRLQMTLLPPILTAQSASCYASSIKRCRQVIGKEVFPENPPGTVFAGDLDLLTFFADVCEQADSGMLLDAAHLAIYQSLVGRSALDGLDDFPLDRIIELHVAGSSLIDVSGLQIWSDDHRPSVRSETWSIAQFIIEHAPNLKAVVFECERNPVDKCIPGFSKIYELLQSRLSG